MKKFFLVVFVFVGGLARSQEAAPLSGAAAIGALWKAAVAAETSKNYDLAIQQLKAFLDAGGSPFVGNLRTGWDYYFKQDYKDAADSYNAAAGLEPSALSPLIGLLNIAQAQGNAGEIKKAADYILRVDPLNYQAQMAQAWMEFKALNYSGSLSYYRHGLLDPFIGPGLLQYEYTLKIGEADFNIDARLLTETETGTPAHTPQRMTTTVTASRGVSRIEALLRNDTKVTVELIEPSPSRTTRENFSSAEGESAQPALARS